MSRAKVVLSDGKYYGVRINCPGCGAKTLATDWTPPGMERSDTSGRHIWQFNGNLDLPTFNPSLLWKSGHYCNNPPAPGNCWCDFKERFPEHGEMKIPQCDICHSFVRDGRIQFLSDCTHALANRTADLPEIES